MFESKNSSLLHSVSWPLEFCLQYQTGLQKLATDKHTSLFHARLIKHPFFNINNLQHSLMFESEH
jgi:hypothetical protein